MDDHLCPECALWYDPASSVPHTCAGVMGFQRDLYCKKHGEQSEIPCPWCQLEAGAHPSANEGQK
jgi:hypothetical protein